MKPVSFSTSPSKTAKIYFMNKFISIFKFNDICYFIYAVFATSPYPRGGKRHSSLAKNCFQITTCFYNFQIAPNDCEVSR